MAEPEFVQIDVDGDGSCFFRAVYGAARYRPDESDKNKGPNNAILKRLYDCLVGGFGLRNIIGLRNANIALHEAEFINNEDVFVDTIRAYLASAIANTDFLERFKEGQKNLYEQLMIYADHDRFLFNSYMVEASTEFQDKFGDAAKFIKLTERKFKDEYASILLNRDSYAAENEYRMMKFLLNECGIQLDSINQKAGSSPAILDLKRDNQPFLLVTRIQREYKKENGEKITIEHYNYLMEKKYYERNKTLQTGPEDDRAALSQWRANTQTYSTSKLKASAAKSAAKKSKAPAKTRKSSVNNSAVAAALANMGLTMDTANANLVQSIRNSLR